MRIESSQVSYATAYRSANAAVVIDETLAQPKTFTSADTVQLSDVARSAVETGREDLQDLDPKQRLAVLALEAIFGQRIRLFRCRLPSPEAATTDTPAAAGPAVHRLTELRSESEQTSFQAEGQVKTADGRSIAFSAEFSLQREFQSATTSVSARTADPLVVNFGGAPARLTGAKIAFDLNSDGNPESISFVAEGSGFLALDKNGDGQVNDGRELFGPQTGSGFAELASYDADRNGWIDEADPVFARLRVWTQDGLSTLWEKGIGAISTSSAQTPFALKDAANTLQGNLRASGVYLSETGAAGTIQQVDLAEG